MNITKLENTHTPTHTHTCRPNGSYVSVSQVGTANCVIDPDMKIDMSYIVYGGEPYIRCLKRHPALRFKERGRKARSSKGVNSLDNELNTET